MPALLFMDMTTGAGGSVCAAYRYVSATPTQIGNTFGTSLPRPNNTGSPKNCIIQFQGDLYAFGGDGIYKKDDPSVMTGDWTSQITFTNPTTVSLRFSGLYPIVVSGALNLVCVFGDAAGTNQWRWAKFDGSTWTQATSAVAAGTHASIDDTLVFNSTIHIIGDSDATVFDPGTDTFSAPTEPFSGTQTSMCIFEGRLLAVYFWGGGYRLAEYTGSWNFIGTQFGSSINVAYTSKATLITDGTLLWAFTPEDPQNVSGPPDHWHVYEFDNTFVPTEITFTVLPGSLTVNQSIRQARFHAVYDLDTTVGTTEIYLYHSTDSVATTAYTMYKWNGNSSVITSVDVGGVVAHALPTGYANNGERIWTAGELDIKITSVVATLGGEQISFIVYGGGTNRKMKLHYALGGEPVLLEATLMSPVTGGSATFNVGLNQVEGIAADGATVYSIVWDLPTDGVDSGTKVIRVPQASI
jgi:hypothetical protein